MAVAHPIRPRRSDLSFDGLPRHWFGGNALATHLINGLHLLFPAGERFFIRTVHRYLSEVTDQELVAQVRGFFGQEAQHAAAHERCFAELERQGFAVDRFLSIYQAIAFRVIEPITPLRLRLAVTVALEHYTAVLADIALRSGILESADPTMKELLSWHAAEEIEHKSVAFEVLRVTGDNHLNRILGMAIASALLGTFWMAGTTSLTWNPAGTSCASDASSAWAPRQAACHKACNAGAGQLEGPNFPLIQEFFHGTRDH